MTEAAANKEMWERLARIDANQLHFNQQIGRMIEQQDEVVLLLGRLVRVEEHVNEQHRTTGRVFTRLEAAEQGLKDVQQEQGAWRTVRKVSAWFVGVAISLTIAFAAFRDRVSG